MSALLGADDEDHRGHSGHEQRPERQAPSPPPARPPGGKGRGRGRRRSAGTVSDGSHTRRPLPTPRREWAPESFPARCVPRVTRRLGRTSEGPRGGLIRDVMEGARAGRRARFSISFADLIDRLAKQCPRRRSAHPPADGTSRRYAGYLGGIQAERRGAAGFTSKSGAGNAIRRSVGDVVGGRHGNRQHVGRDVELVRHLPIAGETRATSSVTGRLSRSAGSRRWAMERPK